MQQLFTILLVMHIIGGATSIIFGSYILFTKKGTKRHRLIGNIYFYAMLTGAIVAMPMSYIHPNYFLFIIAVFTAYMLLTGKRYLAKKSVADIATTDWLLTVVMLIFAVALIILGVYHLLKPRIFGVVFLSFGAISLLFVYKDYKNYSGKAAVKNFGLVTHLQRMMGSYIASVTAFLVVNNRILPPTIVWLLPTVVIVPLIVKWSKKYTVKWQ